MDSLLTSVSTGIVNTNDPATSLMVIFNVANAYVVRLIVTFFKKNESKFWVPFVVMILSGISGVVSGKGIPDGLVVGLLSIGIHQITLKGSLDAWMKKKGINL